MDYIAHQAPLSMGFSRQECWSGLPFPSPGDLPNPGIEPMSPVLACGFFTTEPPAKPKGVSLALLYRETEAVSFPYLLSDGTGSVQGVSNTAPSFLSSPP